eukprot:scaffold80599_cov30-Prasinocladus_malaysianus.AAC.1
MTAANCHWPVIPYPSLYELGRLVLGVSGGKSGEEVSSGEEEWEVLRFAGGLKEYVKYINRDKEAMHEPVYAKRRIDDVEVEIALQCIISSSIIIIPGCNQVRINETGWGKG